MNKKVITITGPHGSGKDTLISNAINLIGNTKKVVSSTDRLPRPGEIPGYSYYYEANKPSETEIFDGITVPSINNRTGIVGVNYWITKSLVDSLFLKDDILYLRHTAPTVIEKLKVDYGNMIQCIYLETDQELLVERLMKRDGISKEDALKRLSHDPGNMKSEINKKYNKEIFDNLINTNQTQNMVLMEFLREAKIK